MFDKKVTHYCPKTGALLRKNPYRLHVINRIEYYERPVGSGNVYFENGEPAGRLGKKDGKKAVDRTEKHLEWQAPMSESQKVQAALSEREKRIAELEAEVARLEAASIEQELNTIVANEEESNKDKKTKKGIFA